MVLKEKILSERYPLKVNERRNSETAQLAQLAQLRKKEKEGENGDLIYIW